MSWLITEQRHYRPVPTRCWDRVVAPSAERRSRGQKTGWNDMNRHPTRVRLHLPSCLAGTGERMSTGRPKIRIGAVMWIAGPIQYLIAQLAAQAAWRTPYSWMLNPLSDPGALPWQRT